MTEKTFDTRSRGRQTIKSHDKQYLLDMIKLYTSWGYDQKGAIKTCDDNGKVLYWVVLVPPEGER